METFTAHFDGKVLIPDEPLDLKAGEKVRITIHRREEATVFGLLSKLPLIHISREDAEAINLDPQFRAEEA